MSKMLIVSDSALEKIAGGTENEETAPVQINQKTPFGTKVKDVATSGKFWGGVGAGAVTMGLIATICGVGYFVGKKIYNHYKG